MAEFLAPVELTIRIELTVPVFLDGKRMDQIGEQASQQILTEIRLAIDHLQQSLQDLPDA